MLLGLLLTLRAVAYVRIFNISLVEMGMATRLRLKTNMLSTESVFGSFMERGYGL